MPRRTENQRSLERDSARLVQYTSCDRQPYGPVKSIKRKPKNDAEAKLETVQFVKIVKRQLTPNTQIPMQPWFLVSRSALLAKIGFYEKGLYAMRAFPIGAIIGQYSGEKVGRPQSSWNDAMSQNSVRELARSGNVYTMAVKDGKSKKIIVVDGTNDASHLQFANDARGISKFTNNCEITDGGYIRTTRCIPAFNMQKSLLDNVDSEIRFDYGDGYWKLYGSEEMPIVLY